MCLKQLAQDAERVQRGVLANKNESHCKESGLKLGLDARPTQHKRAPPVSGGAPYETRSGS